ncbi:MAG TPA: aminoglycoside phosphotransferase family protein [Solirubrobacterales bacterium]|nr:aminoglycoside phosphotransferase family protein [Solirubrobacterales bacterium]
MTLRLTDGTKIVDLSRPLQGMRHRVLFGVEESSGREVAAKIELIPAALEPERQALQWLTLQDGPSPRLHAAGTLDESGEYPGAVCLVTDRDDGETPNSPAGWERLGRALGRLAQIPWEGSGLTTLDHNAFLALHERRVDDLGRALDRDLAATLPTVPPSFSESPLVVTHGDPGPGNFLDDGADGTLIDWEDAQVAPRGLDLGRATFIALLGAGPEGHVARDQAARADAVATGFLAEADWSPAQVELEWWLSVAGVQFAHRRLERAGEPGVLPWLDAVTVLESALAGPPTDRSG